MTDVLTELNSMVRLLYDEAQDDVDSLYWKAAERIAELEGSLEEWVLDGKAMEERITELEAQRDEGRQLVRDWSAECERLKATHTALLARLESLRDKWRKVVYTKTYGNGKPLDKCADELEAIIKEARG